MVARTTLTTKTASIDQATQVQRLPTALPRLLWSAAIAPRLVSVLHRQRPESVTKRVTGPRHGLSVKAAQVSKHLSDGPLGPIGRGAREENGAGGRRARPGWASRQLSSVELTVKIRFGR